MFVIEKRTGDFHLDRGVTDLLKFLCCLVVAACHYAQYVVSESIQTGPMIQLLSTQGGYWGVSVFFFLSGYGLTCSLKNRPIGFLSFVRKRMSRVYLPAVFISLIWVSMLALFPKLQEGNFGLVGEIDGNTIWLHIIQVFALDFCDSVLWFVKVVLLLYLFLYYYMQIRMSGHKCVALLYSLIGSILITILVYFWIAPFASVSIFAFSIGLVVADYNKLVVDKRHWIFVSIPIFLGLGYLLRSDHVIVHGIINYLLLSIGLIFFLNYDLKIDAPTRCLADFSYDLYLSHNKIKVVMILFYPFMSLPLYLFLSVVLAVTLYGLRKALHLV